MMYCTNKIHVWSIYIIMQGKCDFDLGPFRLDMLLACFAANQMLDAQRNNCQYISFQILSSRFLWLKQVQSASGPSGQSLSWFLEHEATRSISTPPWLGCQSITRLHPPPPPLAALNSPLPILYNWVETGTVGVKCLAQEHNTMSIARDETWTT